MRDELDCALQEGAVRTTRYHRRMCGRFAFYSPKEAVLAVFGVELPFDVVPHWNYAPTQLLAALRAGEGGSPEGVRLRWGLVPSWAKEPAIGNRMINARAETIAEKPAYRNAFRRRRCVVLANGFYEWQKAGSGKIPHWIAPRDGGPIAFAGLWERWEKGEAPLETCTIVTTAANEALRHVHDRMPVILPPDAVRAWLEPGAPADVLGALLRPAPEDLLAFHPVSRAVNSPAHDGPGLIEPVPGADA
jgi:putative SOS response-associated peptidase YedK